MTQRHAVFLSLLLVIYCLQSFAAEAAELRVRVMSPFINVHSGPADEFPVFHVIAKGEEIDILKERTGWYKIRTVADADKSIEGWIDSDALKATVLDDGVGLQPSEGSFDDYQTRNFEMSLYGGVLDSTTAMTLGGTWVWTKNLSVEAGYTQAFGNFSDNKIWSVRLRHTLFPEWQISPYLALGTGEIRTTPKSNLVASDPNGSGDSDRTRNSSHYEVGVGLRYYLTDGILVKAEYRGLLALTERDEQERVDQWLVGASFFF